MKKILLIEDRADRQELFLKNTQIDLTEYGDILDNTVEKQNNSFDFEEYSTIIIHKSAFDSQKMYDIEKVCKENKIVLILFSGGNILNYYNVENGFKKLELNSKDFYSNNLKLFLDNYKRKEEIEPLILSYGEKWKLNILLKLLENINIFIANSKSEDIIYDEFVDKTSFNLIEKFKIDYPKPKIEDGWVYLKEIEDIALSLEKYVNEEILYE